ncbi:MAG: type VII secretion protein EccE [Actinomycetota bacterium]|nr:type VII secretion protein EccE [Actinomycetota bacterium]
MTTPGVPNLQPLPAGGGHRQTPAIGPGRASATSLPDRPPERHRRRAAEVPGPPYLLRILLPIRLGAVLGWEIAALAAAIGYQHREDRYGRQAFYAVLAVAVLLVLLTSLRVAGLTGWERLRDGRRLQHRLRGYARDKAADTVQRRLLDGLTLNTHIDRAGNRTGLLGAELGWSALIKIGDAAVPDPAALIEAASRACLRPDLPLAAAQVLSWNVPSAWGEQREGNSANRTLRQYYLSVRTAENPSARAILARGGGPAGAQRATASAAAALAFELTRLGYPCSVLDSAELEQHVQLMSGASYSAQPVNAGTAAAPKETKDTWAVGRIQQSCFRIGGGTSQAAALNWTAGSPLSFVIGSCTITPDRRGQPRLEYLMRAAMISQQSPLTIEQASRTLDKRLIPLRYRQERYVRATLPVALPTTG